MLILNNVHQTIRELVWQTISKHYNVDRREPRMLLYKEIFMDSNPIDDLADTISSAFEQILAQLSTPQEPSNDESSATEQESIQEVNTTTSLDIDTMHDDYSEGDYNWNSYGYDDPFT